MIQIDGTNYACDFVKKNKHNYEGTVTDADSEKQLFKFSFVWRGCWEGRVYFIHDEYWGEELTIISQLWDNITNFLKEQIRAENPEVYE